jgi:hypothetical protein
MSYIIFHYVLCTVVPSVEVAEYVLLKSTDCGHYNSTGSRIDERGEEAFQRRQPSISIPDH